ncbi:MAG TPA: response regulator [Clostridiales bacterium]|nr:response regulator [Clostridiales bacterium]
MYKVFIADDESMVVKSLKASIKWSEYGFEIVGEAYNGIEAYNEITSLKPDIVFTDIRMPGINGLELIKKVREENINTCFVVISGYAEFAYVQKALNYGALGFCLKPFDENEIIGVLNKAKDVIKKSRILIEAELLTIIDDNSSFGRDRKAKILDILGVEKIKETGIQALVTIGCNTICIPEINSISLRIGKNKNAYILSGSNSPESIKGYLARYPGMHGDRDPKSVGNSGNLAEALRNNTLQKSLIGAGLSGVYYSSDHLHDIIDEASVAAYQYFMTGDSDVYQYTEPEQDELGFVLMQLQNSIVKEEAALIQDAFSMVEKVFAEGAYNIKHAFQVYNIVTHSFYSHDSVKSGEYIFDYEQLTNSYKNFTEMLENLSRQLVENAGIVQELTAQDITNETFRPILQYVNENYCKDTSLSDISEIFTVNPSYISQLFKKQTGITFTEYLTNLRVGHACNLLKSTCFSINEIAEKAGFNDYYYFTRVFKKVTGMTPTHYRNKG